MWHSLFKAYDQVLWGWGLTDFEVDQAHRDCQKRQRESGRENCQNSPKLANIDRAAYDRARDWLCETRFVFTSKNTQQSNETNLLVFHVFL